MTEKYTDKELIKAAFGSIVDRISSMPTDAEDMGIPYGSFSIIYGALDEISEEEAKRVFDAFSSKKATILRHKLIALLAEEVNG